MRSVSLTFTCPWLSSVARIVLWHFVFYWKIEANCPQSTLRVVENITQSFGGPLLRSNHNNHIYWMYCDIHSASETKLSKLDSNFRVYFFDIIIFVYIWFQLALHTIQNGKGWSFTRTKHQCWEQQLNQNLDLWYKLKTGHHPGFSWCLFFGHIPCAIYIYISSIHNIYGILWMYMIKLLISTALHIYLQTMHTRPSYINDHFGFVLKWPICRAVDRPTFILVLNAMTSLLLGKKKHQIYVGYV
jgi:hypothetical protein